VAALPRRKNRGACALRIPQAGGNGSQVAAQLIEDEGGQLQRPVDTSLGLLAEHEVLA